MGGGGSTPVLLRDPQLQGPKAKQAALDESLVTQVTPAHKPKGRLALVPEKVPGVSNPACEWGK